MKSVIINANKCIGCKQCLFACAVAHSNTKTILGAIFEKIPPKPRIKVYLSEECDLLPNKCRHCNPAPCEIACMSKAIFRDNKTNAVIIDKNKCIDCGMCAMVCPFNAIKFTLFDESKETAHKCDQCIERQMENKIPACVEVCKTGALVFGEYDNEMEKKGKKLADLVYASIKEQPISPNPYQTLLEYKKSLKTIGGR